MRLSSDIFAKMCDRVAEFVSEDDDLQSGGAAWADHVAVMLHLAGIGRKLTLHLPARFDVTSARFEEKPGDLDPGSIANYYHDLFAARTGFRPLAAIGLAIRGGAKVTVSPGFKARNLLVGDCDRLIAFTFGPDRRWPQDGGTRHCWSNSSARTKLHFPIGDL